MALTIGAAEAQAKRRGTPLSGIVEFPGDFERRLKCKDIRS
jgi:hypothetical protein